MYFWDKHKTVTSYYEVLSGEVCDRYGLTQMEYTAQVRTISLSGTGMSKIKRWRLMAPNKSVWVANESDFYPSINFNFVNDSSSNAKLKGTWSVAFQSSSSSYTFIPSYSVSYYYEYGD